MYTEAACLEQRTAALAPRTGDLRLELVEELSEYFNRTPADISAALENASAQFTEEWRAKVRNPADERSVIRFYDETSTEVFDLADWHASDKIHCRTVIVADLFRRHGVRRVLDYGSGIGSDAIVLAHAGMEVTLADVSSPLLGFARWRCRRHGFDAPAIDLKSQPLPERAFDAAICFDVLEHVPRPLKAVQGIRRALKPDGLLIYHAPFGTDPDRPMHLVHNDPLTGRMRPSGFNWREDLERLFPDWLWTPRAYQRFEMRGFERVGYYIHDVWMPGDTVTRLARLYRQLIPRVSA